MRTLNALTLMVSPDKGRTAYYMGVYVEVIDSYVCRGKLLHTIQYGTALAQVEDNHLSNTEEVWECPTTGMSEDEVDATWPSIGRATENTKRVTCSLK